MLESESSALMMALLMNKLVYAGHAKISIENPRVWLFSPTVSDTFSCGRDINNEPYLGVQQDLLPFWTDSNWTDAAVDYENGYIYLCTKSMDTNELLFGIGIAFRVKRLNVFWPKELKENPHAVMNMKKLSIITTANTNRTLVSDEHVFSGIKLSRVNSPADLYQTAYDENYSNLLLQESGLDESFTSF
jgi:hypothetical protein